MALDSILTFTDARDSKSYRYVVIGGQAWMAENLNFNAIDSKCYGNDEANGNKYGRLYDWATAMDICPSGWHLPDNAEWDKLFHFVDSENGVKGEKRNGYYTSKTVGRYLKAKSGWNWNDEDNISGNGDDKYGFAALPGGNGSTGGYFDNAGYFGYWWSASEHIDTNAYSRFMYHYRKGAYWYYDDKSRLFSVRCVRD